MNVRALASCLFLFIYLFFANEWFDDNPSKIIWPMKSHEIV